MKEQPPKPKIKIKTLIPNLIHLVEKNGKTYYLLKDENGLYVIDKYEADDITYVPKQDLKFKLATPDILKEPMDINFKNLFNEVILFIKSYLEMPSETDYILLALWVFHTYIIEKSNTTPILYFYGMKETGKTRGGEVLSELAFRCERMTSPTEAALFRVAHFLKTSLVIDEIKLWGIDGNKEVAMLIKSRYKRGLAVTRINLLKKDEDQIEYYDVFAPLVICTTETIPDDIESRCFVFLMQKNFKAEVEKTISEEWADNLRQKLIIFRANYLNQELKETEQIARGRLNEISMPLYQILELLSFGENKKEEFKEIMRKMVAAKESEEGFSLEAEIVEEIIKFEKETSRTAFLTTEIVERLNMNKTDKEKVSNRLISIRVRRLGFVKTRLEAGKRGFEINFKLLEKLAKHFKLDFGEQLELGEDK